MCDEELNAIGVAVYPAAAMVNHADAPTAVQSFKGKKIVLRATRDLKRGDEVTMAYVELLATRQERRAALRAGYCSAQLYGFSKANEDYERLMRDEDLANARADERFKALVDKYNVEPSELQLQLDPSQSVIGRAMKMWASKK